MTIIYLINHSTSKLFNEVRIWNLCDVILEKKVILIQSGFWKLHIGHDTSETLPAVGNKAKIWWPPIGDNFGFFDNGGTG